MLAKAISLAVACLKNKSLESGEPRCCDFTTLGATTASALAANAVSAFLSAVNVSVAFSTLFDNSVTSLRSASSSGLASKSLVDSTSESFAASKSSSLLAIFSVKLLMIFSLIY